jgi:hypothetical protein
MNRGHSSSERWRCHSQGRCCRGSRMSGRRCGGNGSVLSRRLKAPPHEDEKDDEKDNHREHDCNPEVRVLPEHNATGSFIPGLCRIPAPVCARTSGPISDANTRRRGLFPRGKPGTIMVGREAVLVTEIFPAVLAVERERNVLSAKITTRHCSFSLFPGIS